MSKPHLILIATETDPSAHKIYEAAQEVADVDFYYYQELARTALPVPQFKRHTQESFLIARQPYTANQVEQNYASLLTAVLDHYQFAKVFDGRLYQDSFIKYEDKYYHNYLFNKLGLPYLKMIDISDPEKVEYPIIAKKRLSSRGDANFIIRSSEELVRFIYNHDITQFVFQEFAQLVADYRVLVLNEQVVTVARRDIVIKYGYKATVKVAAAADLPEEMKAKCIAVAKELKTDLCGLDVGELTDGSYTLIEYNTSPQFVGVERETHINVAEQLVKSLITT